MTDTEIYTQESRWSLILGTLHGFNGRLYICIKFSSGLMVKNPPANEGDQDGFDPWSGKIPWRRKWQSTPIFLPEEFHEERRLVGYSLCMGKESDMS